MSENLKLRLDSPSGETHPDRLPREPDAGAGGTPGPGDAGPNDEAESQMRRALGLLGETPRHRPDAERSDQPARVSDRFNGGLHRRRFVQDGDVPVTVLRRDQPHEAPAHRGVATPPAPTSSRLQRTEAALSAETAARDKAERLLAEMQSVVRDLRTKIGHAELARNEAVDALRQERELITQIRAEGEACQQQLHEAREQVLVAERNAQTYQEHLAEERQARKAAEKALRAAEAARETAEELVQTLSRETPAAPRPRAEPGRRPRVVAEAEPVVTTSRRGRPAETPAVEPEPVKWWLNTKAAAKKR